jgi:hypothetical protein
MSIEAMKQALEAMEKHGTFYLRHEHAYKKAITALRQAIAEAEKQEPVANMLGNMFEACGIGIGFGDAKLESSNVTHIYSTGVPMAKPDAVQYDKDGNEMAHWRFNQTPLKQEPVAWIVDGEIKVRLDMAGKLYYSETNVYTSPPKREWVGLDPETMRNTTLDFNHGALWAERYLKEKNT